MKKVIVAMAVVPMIVACSTGSVRWESGMATATAEAVSIEAAKRKAHGMLREVCKPSSGQEPLSLGTIGKALGVADQFFGLFRQYSFEITRSCNLQE